jgi:hypothetical protein
MGRAPRHRLLERQLKKARGKDPDAALDLERLLDFVSHVQNGTMVFDSELGVGSVFKVDFPCASLLSKAG